MRLELGFCGFGSGFAMELRLSTMLHDSGSGSGSGRKTTAAATNNNNQTGDVGSAAC